jgi:hypothetical protein
MLPMTHSFQLQENFWSQAAHMKHVIKVLNYLTKLHWKSTSGKLCILWVRRFQTHLQSVSKHRFHSLCNYYICICSETQVEVPRAHTHSHTHGRISMPQRPITAQNTTNPRNEYQCTEQYSNMLYQQSSGRRTHDHRDRRLFIKCILRSLFFRKHSTLISSYRVLNVVYWMALDWVSDMRWRRTVSLLEHC